MARLLPALAAALLIAALAPAAARAAEMSKSDIEKIVHDYLVAHPEVLQEAMAELEKRQAAADAQKHKDAVKQNAAALFSSPHQVVLGNPEGKVTFVEFFD